MAYIESVEKFATFGAPPCVFCQPPERTGGFCCHSRECRGCGIEQGEARLPRAACGERLLTFARVV